MNYSNKNILSLFTLLIISVQIFTTSAVQAEQLIKSDGHNIHYNAFNSAMLSPEVASQYGIKRSTSLGVLNISVMNASEQSVTAFVKGNAKNSLSQLKILTFHKITEGAAIYYIATFNFADKEQLVFDIVVVPEGKKKTTKLSFSQQFFVG